jgi:hypothetical protein
MAAMVGNAAETKAGLFSVRKGIVEAQVRLWCGVSFRELCEGAVLNLASVPPTGNA